MSNLTPFFATEADTAALLNAINKVRPLRFVRAGLFESSSFQTLFDLSNCDPLATYLVAEPTLVIAVRDVPQRDGGRRFAIDQTRNPGTVALRPGGLLEPGCLLAGQVGTVTRDATSLSLYQVFATEMRKQYALVKSYRVGKEAYALLRSGARLTGNPHSPRAYDLTLSSP